MNKNILFLAILGLLLAVAVVQTIQINNIRDGISGDVVKESSAGETYDEMIARMHPDQVSGNNVQNAPTMVGGCWNGKIILEEKFIKREKRKIRKWEEWKT